MQKVIGEQLGTIRRKLGVPIIYHVEDYAFEKERQMSPEERERHYFNLLEHGLRYGVDYLVIDMSCSSDRIKQLVKHSGRTKIIGQFSAMQEVKWSWHDQARMTEYAMAEELGCNLVKFVRHTSDPEDNVAVQSFRRKVDSIPHHLPVC